MFGLPLYHHPHHYGIYVKSAVLIGALWAGYVRKQSLSWYLGGMVMNLLCYEPFIALTLTSGAAVNLLRYHRPLRWPFNSVLLSMLFAIAVVAGARTWMFGNTLGPLFEWLAIGFYYWVVANGLASGGQGAARAGLVVGTVAAVSTALWEYRRGDLVSTGADWHQNVFAMVGNAIFPVLLLGGLHADLPATEAAVWVASGTSLGAAVLLTLSRTGLAISGGLLTLCGIRSLGRDVPSHRRHWALLGLSLIACGWCLRQDAINTRFEKAPLDNLRAREVYSRVAEKLWLQNPLGVGLGKFESVSVGLYKKQLWGYPAAPIHNVFVQVGTELGWLGLGVFVLVVARFLLLSCTGLRQPHRNITFAGVLLAQISLLLNHLMAPDMLRPPAALIALFVAAMADNLQRAGNASRPP